VKKDRKDSRGEIQLFHFGGRGGKRRRKKKRKGGEERSAIGIAIFPREDSGGAREGKKNEDSEVVVETRVGREKKGREGKMERGFRIRVH